MHGNCMCNVSSLSTQSEQLSRTWRLAGAYSAKAHTWVFVQKQTMAWCFAQPAKRHLNPYKQKQTRTVQPLQLRKRAAAVLKPC